MEFDFTRYIKRQEPTIIEIGAHNGSDTEWFLDNFVNPEVHCFEPYPPMFEELAERLKTRSQCKLFLNKTALGKSTEVVTFFPADNTYSGSLKKPALHKVVRPDILFAEDGIQVGCTTLDAYASAHTIRHCDLIYMDVQGAEDMVIEGGRHFITNRVRYIYTEYSNVNLYESAPSLDDIMKKLWHYQVVFKKDDNSWSGNALLVNRIFEES